MIAVWIVVGVAVYLLVGAVVAGGVNRFWSEREDFELCLITVFWPWWAAGSLLFLVAWPFLAVARKIGGVDR